jgi:hypothetical protein
LTLFHLHVLYLLLCLHILFLFRLFLLTHSLSLSLSLSLFSSTELFHVCACVGVFIAESVLHRIPGLSTFFLYLNDDVLLGRRTTLTQFWKPGDPRLGRPHAYLAYTNYGLNARCQPWGNQRAPQWIASTARLTIQRACMAEMLYWDRVVAAKVFHVALYNSFAHTPHLFHTPTLFLVEKRLAATLAISRRNTFRDPATDITWLLQYEAALRESDMLRQYQQHTAAPAATATTSESDPFVPLPVTVTEQSTVDWPAYLHEQMQHCDHVMVQQFFVSMEAKFQQRRPVFFAIEDDLKAPDVACVKLHRELLTQFLQTHWPTAAPWER